MSQDAYVRNGRYNLLDDAVRTQMSFRHKANGFGGKRPFGYIVDDLEYSYKGSATLRSYYKKLTLRTERRQAKFIIQEQLLEAMDVV